MPVEDGLDIILVDVEVVAVADGGLKEDADREGELAQVLVLEALQVEVAVLFALDVKGEVEVGVGVLAALGCFYHLLLNMYIIYG